MPIFIKSENKIYWSSGFIRNEFNIKLQTKYEIQQICKKKNRRTHKQPINGRHTEVTPPKG